MKNLTSNSLGTVVRRINQDKNWQKGQGPMAWPLTGNSKPFAEEWLKWPGVGEEKFPGFLNMGVPHNVIPKPTGEALIWATVRLRWPKTVIVDRIMKDRIFNRCYVKFCQLYWMFYMRMNILLENSSLPQIVKSKPVEKILIETIIRNVWVDRITVKFCRRTGMLE